MHCCWFGAVWAEQVTRQSNYTCSRLYFGHYHLPPYSCTGLFFLYFMGITLSQNCWARSCTYMYYKYFVVVLFFVFWALSLLSAELHSCSKFSTHSKSKCSSSAMGPGQNTNTNAESSFKIWLQIPKFPRLFGCRTKTV